jgi:tetratricopeptide (TPR) repeat protein
VNLASELGVQNPLTGAKNGSQQRQATVLRGFRRSLLIAPAAITLGVCLVIACRVYVARTNSVGPAKRPFFAGLGKHGRPITTNSPLAQRYFDQGLAFLYAFDANGANWSFRWALECDPDCAMAFWGMAMANGPRLNVETPTTTRELQAWRALQGARMRLGQASPVERALIEALGTRHSDPPRSDRAPLDRDYAKAMRRVWKMFPEDADVGALTAEAIMLLHPGDLWRADGTPRAETTELINVLNEVFVLDPEHPFAVHLWVHAYEGSRTPEKADTAADMLRTMCPGLQHLLHMPSHVDIRRGRWQDAVLTSQRAVAAGAMQQEMTGGLSPTYFDMVHNYHMLAYSAMMRGQSGLVDGAIDGLLRSAQKSADDPRHSLDGYVAMRYESHLRFGRWREMLGEPEPAAADPLDKSLWHYARGVAFAATRRVSDAKREHAAVIGALKDVSKDATFREVPIRKLIVLAERILAGEILYREGKVGKAIATLIEAVKREDALPLYLPPVWFMHSRHALGATLIDAKLYSDAEFVYRDDLKLHPENGWSLFGLAESLKMQGKSAEAAAARQRFEAAWRDADFSLSSSCCCLPGKVARQRLAGPSALETAATHSQTRKDR